MDIPADQAYTTPLVIRVGDQDQLISVGAFRVRAYEPLTGKEIWRVRYDEGFSNVPRPVFGHGLVFITTGFQQPELLAIRPDGKGDVTKTHIAWSLKRGAPLTPSPIIVGDELYIVNDGGIASCIDARTGNVIWQSRLGGTYSASPIYADGRLYFPAEQGVTTVIAPGRKRGGLRRTDWKAATSPRWRWPADRFSSGPIRRSTASPSERPRRKCSCRGGRKATDDVKAQTYTV